MVELVMVRHGQSEHNRERIIQGQIDSELTAKGRKEAEKVAESLSRTSFDRIYSSDLTRARDTAEIISRNHENEVILREELRERNYGELEGEGYLVWKDMDPEDHHGWKMENGESLKEHKQRVSEVLEEITQAGIKKGLMVTHGGTISATLMHVLNCESRRARRFGIETCSITRLEHTEEGWIIKEVNETCHL